MWDTGKHFNIHRIGDPEGKERKQKKKKKSEAIIVENFLNLMKILYTPAA